MTRVTFALLAGAFLATAADPLPKAETILDRYVEVTGGSAAYEKVHSEVVKGKMEMAGKGIAGSLISYQAEPNKDYTAIDLEGAGKIESGSDGDVFWERSAIAGPRIKTGQEREEIVRAAIFNPHFNWRKIYDKVETAGSETVEGEDCYKVVLTPKGGRPVTEYYSKKSGFLIKESSVHATQMGDIAAEAIYKDYKTSGGLTAAFTRIEKFAGQEIVFKMDSIEYNGGIPKDRFDLPEDIKALVRKNGGTNEKK